MAIDHHCSVCGEHVELDGYCAEHPKASVDSTVTSRAPLLAAALRARLAAGLPPGDERELLRAELQAALSAAGTKAGACEVLGCSRPALDGWLELAGLEVERITRAR